MFLEDFRVLLNLLRGCNVARRVCVRYVKIAGARNVVAKATVDDKHCRGRSSTAEPLSRQFLCSWWEIVSQVGREMSARANPVTRQRSPDDQESG